MQQARGASDLTEENTMKSFNVMATNLTTNTERLVAVCSKATDAAMLAYKHNTANGFDPRSTYIVKASSK